MRDSRIELLKTYSEIFIYSTVLTVAAMVISGVASVGFRDIMQGLVPFYGRSLWYGFAYISLLLFKPFLDVLLKQSRKFRLMMGGAIVFLFVLPSTMPSFAGIEYISDMCWFVAVYLLVGVWKTAVGFKSRVNAVILSSAFSVALIKKTDSIFSD